MTAKTGIDVDEYLRMEFEGADCDYVDGEIVERNVGELPHARIQKVLVLLLSFLEEKLRIEVMPEIRIQIRRDRYRVADIAVWRAGSIGETIPTVAPFLAVEILSPEDRMVRMLPKIRDYLSIGVECVWVIDPAERKALSFSKADPGGTLCDVLRTAEPAIEIPLADLFKQTAPR